MKGATMRAVLALAAMFLLGGVAGAGVMRWLQIQATLAHFDQAPDEAQRHALETVLQHRLGLDDTQARAVQVVLRSQADAQRQLRREIEPQAHALREDTARRIRGVLRPDQQPSFDQLVQGHEQRLARWLRADAGAR